MIYHYYKAIQIHIPKTGGVTLRSLFTSVPPDKKMHWKPIQPEYQDYWNDYSSFTFVRNPWDRFVSCYLFGLSCPTGQAFNKELAKESPDFKTFVMEWLTPDIIDSVQRYQPQYYWTHNKDTKVPYGIKYICRFEKFRQHILWLINIYQIPTKNIKIPVLNATKDRKPYMEYYDKETYEKVKTLYKQDIDIFEYSFEGE